MKQLTVGDRVIDQYGGAGYIARIYDDFSACGMSCQSMSGKEWLEQQIIPYKESELNERWFSVMCDGGGSVWTCESKLELENTNDK